MNQEFILKTSEIILDNLQGNVIDWENGEFSIIAASGVSPSFKYPQVFRNENSEIIDYDYFTLSNSELFVQFFKALNLSRKINKLTFIFKDRKFVEFTESWDQSVQDEFEMYLPKSKKGKIRAWYLPPLEESSHTMEEIQGVIKLPKTTVQFVIDRNQPVETLITELNRAVFYPEDPLWDGAFYWIKKVDGVFTTHCDLFLFPSLEDKEAGFQAEETTAQLEVSEGMKELYDLIVARYAAENPDVPFDSIFVTVQRDGRYIVNYEYRNEEVQPDLTPEPEEITATYLVENLVGCLEHNAPDDYIWLVEILSKYQNEEGKTVHSGEFFYSLYEDKSDMQRLQPGDTIYMLNVSDRLLNEFMLEETKGWKKIVLMFRKDIRLQYKIIDR